MAPQGNPSELKAALYFALLYAFILLTIAAVKDGYGARGLYVVAATSGVAEVHALALSTSQLVETGRLESSAGGRIVMVAIMSSLVFKVAIVTVIGGGRLWKKVALPYVLSVAVGVGIVLVWQ